MFGQRHFQIALALSLLAHSALFTTWPGGGDPADITRPNRQVELIYVLPPASHVDLSPGALGAAAKRDTEEFQAVDEREEKVPIPRQAETEEAEPAIAEAVNDGGSAAHERTLSELASMELGEKEDYVDYCFFIRENIQRALNENYHTNQVFLEGDVLLNFTLYASGDLKKSCIVDTYSTAGPLIRTLVLKSLREASPFPPFPRGLRRSEVSFNIPIAFETE